MLQAPQADKNILVANAEDDGLAYDAEGHVYVDTAITDAAASAGPFEASAAKRVGLCHFPTTARDPWQVRHKQSSMQNCQTGGSPLTRTACSPGRCPTCLGTSTS